MSAVATPWHAPWSGTASICSSPKCPSLGERVEDTFLIDGPELQQHRAQIAIETELLEALSS
ncbi:hypothetical protein [Polaromonas sp.]|uniref:hypothetical protein n=1 Tax=Polaromonas sp. TaxID=1869339 RepID=UPI0027304D13|nr:hypothetical protein [Polaromonas sp.]MDP1742467.1 hypothetical protein [Polaromonas sp.]